MRFSTQSLTLSLAALLLVFPSFASAHDAIPLAGRDILPAHRMLRMRAFRPNMINRRVAEASVGQNEARGLLSGLLGGDDGNSKNPASDAAASSTQSATPATNTSTGSGSNNPPSTGTTDDNGAANNTPSPSPSSDGGLLGGLESIVFGGDSSPTSSATTQSTSSAASTTSSASARTTASLAMSFLPVPTDQNPTTTGPAANSSATDATDLNPDVADRTAFSHTTIIILIVIASSIVGAAVIWTVIRKWKFSPSRQFEDRLQRIDWQPAAAHEGALSAGLGGGFRHAPPSTTVRDMSERRASHGSFGSSDRMDPPPPAAAAPGNNNMSVAPDFPPPHDFTAVPTVGPYVDLARGPSLNRGTSLNRAGTGAWAAGPSYGRARYGGAGGYPTQPPQQYSYGY